MGVIRSCYTCPVFWYQGQTTPDLMYWYFTDRCAQPFPWRHSFQSHNWYEKDDPPNDMGEQRGPRPYSKGHGPIGAPTVAVLPAGDLQWFIDGVPPLQPRLPLNCPSFVDGGTYPLPPPVTWGFPLGPLVTSPIGGPLDTFLDINGYANYSVGPFDVDIPEATYIQWFQTSTQGGMQLDIWMSDGPHTPGTRFTGVFQDLRFTLGTWTWHYLFSTPRIFPPDQYVIVNPCFP